MTGKIAAHNMSRKPLADRLEQIGLVGEMSVDLRLGGAGLFGDLAQAHLGAQPVDGAERGVDDLCADLLAMFAPTLAAGIDFDPRLAHWNVAVDGLRTAHCTGWQPLTCQDRDPQRNCAGVR